MAVALTCSEWQTLASLATYVRVPAGSLLTPAATELPFAALVVSGCLRVFFRESDGTERVLYFAPENWCAADMESWLSGRPATLCVDALQETECLLIDRSGLSSLHDSGASARRVLLSLTERMLAWQQRRLLGALRKTAMQRYLDFLALYPGLDLKIAQYHIAGYLGISPEFLSRLRGRLRSGARRSGRRRLNYFNASRVTAALR